MVFVCAKHVKEALKRIHIPHIQSISDKAKTSKNLRCDFCCQQANYKLFDYFPIRKRGLKNII